VSVREIKSADGLHRIVIEVNAMNLWHFRQEYFHEDDEGTYWFWVDSSGFYVSAEAAEQAARLQFPWLRDGQSS
jgi:hypothetical protein